MSRSKQDQPLQKLLHDTYYNRVERAVWPYVELARINGLVGVWLTFWPCCEYFVFGLSFANC
jgi:hypothetical protein